MTNTRFIITKLSTNTSYNEMTLEDAADFLGIDAGVLQLWYSSHPGGGRKGDYIIVPSEDVDLSEKVRERLASTWGKKFASEWEKACEPFRRLEKRREAHSRKDVDVVEENTIWAS